MSSIVSPLLRYPHAVDIQNPLSRFCTLSKSLQTEFFESNMRLDIRLLSTFNPFNSHLSLTNNTPNRIKNNRIFLFFLLIIRDFFSLLFFFNKNPSSSLLFFFSGIESEWTNRQTGLQ